MELIFGGAYQGKLAYAQETYPMCVHYCRQDSLALPDGPAILSGYHMLVLAQLRAGLDPCTCIETQWEALSDKVILLDDISCGIVPMDAETRAWREAVGRAAGLLTAQAESVTRMFCGLPMRLK